MTANVKRGDVTITLDGRALVLRPSFAVIVELENEFGCGIFDLARDFAGGKLGNARTIAKIIEIGLMGVEQDMPRDIPQAMMETGLMRCVEPIGKFLAHGCGIET